ncbi:MAG: hypothetical protein A2283_06935 [Lentisphaerae bacterium RIFOXYA12_FULL_48_11]|nr:MAG: hypothetical protein A2283_06935 [Lentisphaerae bacterium RIFOXYA12_FULL_48_11]
MQNTENNQKSLNMRLPPQKLAEMLDRTRWASDFSWSQISKISEHMQAFSSSKGTVIFREGATDQSLGIIVEGKVDIIKTDRDVSSLIATLLPSQSFGEMSLVDGEPRSASVVASTDVVMLILDKDGFLEMSRVVPGLAFKLLLKISKMISQRLRKTSGQLVDHLHTDN